MELLNVLLDNSNWPVATALLLGILTSLSPCPLATSITAIAFISKEASSPRRTILSGLFYTLGRGISYTALAILLYAGLSSFQLAQVFQGWGDKVLGPLLIIVGLVMADFITVRPVAGFQAIERAKLWLASKGYVGALLLGMIFALAFCPYSGVLFFGALVPLIMQSVGGLLLPSLFALGTSLPVMVFAILLAFSVQRMSRLLSAVQRAEKLLRLAVAVIFILAGLYYTQFLVKYFLNL
jgi:cytochrome c-type biogenesis protein